jgi:hypothetical protein
MKRSLAVLVLITAFSVRSHAAPPILEATNITATQTGINGALLSGGPSFLTVVGAYSTLSIYVQLTRVAATTVNMTCVGGPSAGVLAPLGVVAVGSTGTLAVVPSVWSYPVTTSGVLRMLVGPLNDAVVQCTFSGTGATSDTIAVSARLGGLP